MSLCQLPRLPSELLGMRAAGYDEWACLGFDAGIVRAARRLEAMARETVEKVVPAGPKTPKGKVRVQAPKYTREELLAAYGVAEGDEDGAAVADGAIGRYRAEDFDRMDWDDGGGGDGAE